MVGNSHTPSISYYIISYLRYESRSNAGSSTRSDENIKKYRLYVQTITTRAVYVWCIYPCLRQSGSSKLNEDDVIPEHRTPRLTPRIPLNSITAKEFARFRQVCCSCPLPIKRRVVETHPTRRSDLSRRPRIWVQSTVDRTAGTRNWATVLTINR